MDGTVTVRRVDPADLGVYLDGLTDVLVDCVEGGASVGFLLPFPRERAAAFWSGVAAGLAAGERALLVALDDDKRVVGTVQLITATPDNQPHRADVAKMLVHGSARRRGVAGQLLASVEGLAAALGKRVLVLDAVTGGDAERLYERAGWQRVGVIPRYALMPDGAFCATTYFYKDI